MASTPNESALYQSLLAADEAGIRIEMVGGVGYWEFMPSPQHQSKVFEIQKSIRPAHSDSSCGCFHYADIYIQFGDGSFKRPDISIFCQSVPEEESQGAVSVIPDAVVEIVSKGSEKKDLEIGPPYLLANGVKDVLVLNPFEGQIHHYRRDGANVLPAPQEFVLECGCVLRI